MASRPQIIMNINRSGFAARSTRFREKFEVDLGQLILLPSARAPHGRSRPTAAFPVRLGVCATETAAGEDRTSSGPGRAVGRTPSGGLPAGAPNAGRNSRGAQRPETRILSISKRQATRCDLAGRAAGTASCCGSMQLLLLGGLDFEDAPLPTCRHFVNQARR